LSILFVDDNRDAAASLADLLQLAGSFDLFSQDVVNGIHLLAQGREILMNPFGQRTQFFRWRSLACRRRRLVSRKYRLARVARSQLFSSRD
jgi:hypothetical protein